MDVKNPELDFYGHQKRARVARGTRGLDGFLEGSIKRFDLKPGERVVFFSDERTVQNCRVPGEQLSEEQLRQIELIAAIDGKTGQLVLTGGNGEKLAEIGSKTPFDKHLYACRVDNHVYAAVWAETPQRLVETLNRIRRKRDQRS